MLPISISGVGRVRVYLRALEIRLTSTTLTSTCPPAAPAAVQPSTSRCALLSPGSPRSVLLSQAVPSSPCSCGSQHARFRQRLGGHQSGFPCVLQIRRSSPDIGGLSHPEGTHH